MPKSFLLIVLTPSTIRSTAVRWAGLLAALLAALVAAGPAAGQPFPTGAPPASPRATWVVRDALLSPKEIRRMVDDASLAGITDLFVQVRGRGDAYYESDLVPPGPPLLDSWRRFGRYDPLAMVLDLAHERDIRVHAWLNVYLVWSGKEPPDGHVVLEHPEWVASDRGGTSMAMMSKRAFESAWTEGVYLDPGRRDVVQHFLDVVRELVERYPVDGIHLDYARYPAMDVGYNDAMRAGYQRRTGIDPMELEANASGLKRERGSDGYAELLGEWRTFKAAQVTALVGAVRGLTRSMRPDIMLSAAVKPDAEAARGEVGQDWVRWVNDGLVDVVAPMMYSTSRATVRRQAEELARLVPPNRVWPGIAVYNQSLSAAESKIRDCRAAGLDGFSIYSYNSLPGGGRSLARLSQAR